MRIRNRFWADGQRWDCQVGFSRTANRIVEFRTPGGLHGWPEEVAPDCRGLYGAICAIAYTSTRLIHSDGASVSGEVDIEMHPAGDQRGDAGSMRPVFERDDACLRKLL
jgi:hypothetical protein